MPTSSKARRTLDRTARSTMASAAPAAAASSTARPTRISLSVNEPAPTQHTGATPRMQAIRIPSSGEYSDFTLSPTGGKSPRPPDMPSAEEVEKKVARTSNAGDAASSSRNASRHASIDENSREAMLAMLATGEDGEGDDDSSDDEEGESLARMMRLRQQKASPAPGSRSSPRLRPSSRSSPAGPIALMAGASSAAAATSTPPPAAKARARPPGGKGSPRMALNRWSALHRVAGLAVARHRVQLPAVGQRRLGRRRAHQQQRRAPAAAVATMIAPATRFMAPTLRQRTRRVVRLVNMAGTLNSRFNEGIRLRPGRRSARAIADCSGEWWYILWSSFLRCMIGARW